MVIPTPEALDAQFRPVILGELESLQAVSQSAGEDRKPVELDQQALGRVSRGDLIQVQAMAQAADRRRSARRGQLRAALERLGEGEFGWCVECGEFIGMKRLEIDPAVTRCMECASN